MAANNTHKHNKNFPNSVLNKIISTTILKNSTPAAKGFTQTKSSLATPSMWSQATSISQKINRGLADESKDPILNKAFY